MDSDFIEEKEIDSCPVISTEFFLSSFKPEETQLFLGVGMPSMNKIREKLYKSFKARSFHFNSFISKHSTIYTHDIGEGTIIFAGVQIGRGVKIGVCNYFGMGTVISHDCKIGDYNFFSPSCALCGDIHVGKGNFIGANSTLRNSINILDYVLVGAGAYVDHDVCSGKVIVPSRSIQLGNKTSEDFMK